MKFMLNKMLLLCLHHIAAVNSNKLELSEICNYVT